MMNNRRGVVMGGVVVMSYVRGERENEREEDVFSICGYASFARQENVSTLSLLQLFTSYIGGFIVCLEIYVKCMRA